MGNETNLSSQVAADGAAVLGLLSAAGTPAQSGATFDSGAASEAIGGGLECVGVQSPGMKKLLAQADRFAFGSGDGSVSGTTVLARAIFDAGVSFQQAHGKPIPPERLGHMLHIAGSFTFDDGANTAVATNMSSDARALHPRAPIIALQKLAMFGAPTFVSYLPANPSGEAVLGIVSHESGSTFGGYAKGESINGGNGGKTLFSPRRVHVLSQAFNSGKTVLTGKLTAVQNGDSTCNQSGAAIAFKPRRAAIHVNGRPAAEVAGSPSSSGVETLAGTITLAGVAYAVTGTWNHQTGAIVAMEVNPALPNGVKVSLHGVIDYEPDAKITPSVGMRYASYKFHADITRGVINVAAESQMQLAEVGVSPMGVSQAAMLQQMSNEGHAEAVRMLKLVADGSPTVTHDMEWSARSAQMSRRQILADITPALFELDTMMMAETNDYASSHVYVSSRMAGIVQGLPPDMFTPSGLSPRPGIYRLGTWGAREVYVDPGIIDPSPNSSKLLFCGSGSQVGFNPIIGGAVSAPMMTPLGVNVEQVSGMAYISRDFLSQNPMIPPAAYWLEIINIG